MADEPTTTELATGGPLTTLIAVGQAIFGKTEPSLTFDRGVVDSVTGFTLRAIDRALEAALGISFEVPTRPAVPIAEPLGAAARAAAEAEAHEAVTVESLTSGGRTLATDLGEFLDRLIPQSLSLEGLLERLSDLLLNPSRVPGEPCLAPTPLLNDLLDLALGKLGGVIGATIGKVSNTVADLLFPAAATGDALAGFVQAVLDDPITAALNLILGARNQTDCVVAGSLGVGEGVIETQIHRLEARLLEVLA